MKAVHFSPEWKRREDMAAITKEIGATVEASFEGASVVWNGWLFDDAGRAQVTIDGKDVAIVDQYGPTRGEPFKWEYGNLQSGGHNLKIKLLAQKNDKSKDHWINVGSIIPPGAPEPEFDAAKMDSTLAAANIATAPIVLIDVTGANGKPVRLRDFATAGEGGVTYTSWLKVKNASPTPFSETNPWRNTKVGR
jgi:hypothetical protein